MQQCRALKCIIHVHCRTAYLGAPDRAVDRGQLAGLDRVQHVQGYGVQCTFKHFESSIRIFLSQFKVNTVFFRDIFFQE